MRQDNWWTGLNFSIGSQTFQAEKKDFFEKMAEFHQTVKIPKHLNAEHDKLEEEIIDFEEQWGDKIGEDDDLVEAIAKFKGWLQQMRDPKSKFELLKKAIESILQMGEAATGSWGKTYNSEHQKYYPEEHSKKLSKAGGWIMIVPESIPVEHSPEQYSIYYAKADILTKEITPEFCGPMKVSYYRVRITTDHGALCLWPHEYVIINDIREIMEEVGTNYELVRLGGDANYDSAKVHYLGTRGISQSDVYDMLLGAVNSTAFCYFKLTNPTTRDYYTFFFDCIERGISLNMIDRLWKCKQTGEPLFKVKYMLEGKEVTEDEFKANPGKNRPEGDTVKDQPASEAGTDNSNIG